ncbi:hypothetical protein EV421DRAFT_1742286 [Armillaria borealis]|uniref:Uncharacterized protein n=1 Tax=Armillaria borealis TaxID=47425 RepID=A0AA39IZ11_9AGAR|nr:hypothetical protein EV421DRAFT_1742286 [Armillaria borealis]
MPQSSSKASYLQSPTMLVAVVTSSWDWSCQSSSPPSCIPDRRYRNVSRRVKGGIVVIGMRIREATSSNSRWRRQGKKATDIRLNGLEAKDLFSGAFLNAMLRNYCIALRPRFKYNDEFLQMGLWYGDRERKAASVVYQRRLLLRKLPMHETSADYQPDKGTSSSGSGSIAMYANERSCKR